jgi:endonuclease YncB( thermonuclease family)
VKCIEVDRDQYKRAVAVCTVAGIDLADWMVRSGLGLDWPTSRRMKQSAPNVAYGAAVLLNLGGIVLAEDRADYPSAVLIS